MGEYRALSDAYRSDLELAVARPISATYHASESHARGAWPDGGFPLSARAGYGSQGGAYSSQSYTLARVSGIPYEQPSKGTEPKGASVASPGGLMGKNVYAG